MTEPEDARRPVDKLTAEEARTLADDLGFQLYHAQDALAFVEECCAIADREGRTVTTGDVREWLKGARCGRQLAASLPAPAPAADGPSPVVLRDPCPHCEDCPLIPRDQMVQHQQETHPETMPGVPS